MKGTTAKGAGKIQYPTEINPIKNNRKQIFWSFQGLMMLASIQNKRVNIKVAKENPRAKAIAPSVVNLGNFMANMKTAANALSPITITEEINPVLKIL